MSTLILTALPDELKAARAPADVSVVYTGVGKLNAAHATIDAIAANRPSLVINYGTAGKIKSSLRGLHEISEVVQRDMMAEPLAPRGRDALRAGARSVPVRSNGRVVCGTGDSFVTSSDRWLTENGVDLVDMELFGIAFVCARAQIPWRAFKFGYRRRQRFCSRPLDREGRQWRRPVLG